MHSEDMELFMEEVSVVEKSSFVGSAMMDVNKSYTTGANILALKKKGEKKMLAAPGPEIVIGEGDMFVALGTRARLKELEGLN